MNKLRYRPPMRSPMAGAVRAERQRKTAKAKRGSTYKPKKAYSAPKVAKVGSVAKVTGGGPSTKTKAAVGVGAAAAGLGGYKAYKHFSNRKAQDRGPSIRRKRR